MRRRPVHREIRMRCDATGLCSVAVMGGLLFALAFSACAPQRGEAPSLPSPVAGATPIGSPLAGTMSTATVSGLSGSPQRTTRATPSASGSPVATGCTPTRWGPSTTSPIDDAPVRSSVGKGHVLTGVVKSSRDCAPVAGAKIILWLANPQGEYDDDHRAAVFTDSAGGYRFESNFPGSYGGRPQPHIHLYVSATGYRGIEQEYHPSPGQTEGTFDIVLAPELR